LFCFFFFTCVGLFVHVTVKYSIFAKKAIKLTQFIIILILFVFLKIQNCRWFSLGTPVSSINKTDRRDINEISLKVALNTIKQTNKQTNNSEITNGRNHEYK
jgi:hypothetical protein